MMVMPTRPLTMTTLVLGKTQSKQEAGSTYAAPMYRSSLLSTIIMSLMMMIKVMMMRVVTIIIITMAKAMTTIRRMVGMMR